MILDLCQIEIMLKDLLMADKFSFLSPKSLKQGSLLISEFFPKENKIVINPLIIDPHKLEDNVLQKEFFKLKSITLNSFLRAGLLSPTNLDEVGKTISKWDDILLGVDTNLFYFCGLTNFLLNSYSYNQRKSFFDNPNWIAFIIPAAVLGEIENKANYTKDSFGKRVSLRALQEIFLLKRSSDVSGVSVFVSGSMALSVEPNKVIRDYLIREQFKEFVKNLDFNKGAYFVTADRACASISKAEGIKTLFVKMPELEKEIELFSSNRANISEIIYEFAVSFSPLVLKIEKDGKESEIKFEINWNSKDLSDWEKWKINMSIIKDELNMLNFEKTDFHKKMLQGWNMVLARKSLED